MTVSPGLRMMLFFEEVLALLDVVVVDNPGQGLAFRVRLGSADDENLFLLGELVEPAGDSNQLDNGHRTGQWIRPGLPDGAVDVTQSGC